MGKKKKPEIPIFSSQIAISPFVLVETSKLLNLRSESHSQMKLVKRHATITALLTALFTVLSRTMGGAHD